MRLKHLLIAIMLCMSSAAVFGQSADSVRSTVAADLLAARKLSLSDSLMPKIVYVHDTVYVDKDKKKKKKKIYNENTARFHRFDREIQKTNFVPKGTWTCGLAFSYGSRSYDNINMLVLRDVTVDGYGFGISPHVGYFFTDNISAGLRFNYTRDYVNLENLDVNLGEDFNIKLQDLYYLQHNYQASGYIRTYMSLGGSREFGFFKEVRRGDGYSQGKNSVGKYEAGTLDATYQTINNLHIGFAPGIAVFVQDWMAMEAQMGVMGVNFNWTKQTHNQVEEGTIRTFSGKFKVDLFSISIGTVFYL